MSCATFRERTPLPLEVHRAVVRLVVARGIRAAAIDLRVSPTILEDLRVPTSLLMPKTLVRVRERLVELGELVA